MSGACRDAMPLNRLWRTVACGLHSFMHTSSHAGASFCSLSPDLRALSKGSPAVRGEKAVPLLAIATALKD